MKNDYSVPRNNANVSFRIALSGYYDGHEQGDFIPTFHMFSPQSHELDEHLGNGFSGWMSLNFSKTITYCAFTIESAINEIIDYMYGIEIATPQPRSIAHFLGFKKTIARELLKIKEDGVKQVRTEHKLKKLLGLYGGKFKKFKRGLKVLFALRDDLTVHYKPLDFTVTKIYRHIEFLRENNLIASPHESENLIPEVSNGGKLSWVYAVSNNRLARWALLLVKDILVEIELHLNQIANKDWGWSDIVLYGRRVYHSERPNLYKNREIFYTLKAEFPVFNRYLMVHQEFKDSTVTRYYHGELLEWEKNPIASAGVKYRNPSYSSHGLILHNEDGPAIEKYDFATGETEAIEYWIDGKKYTEGEFRQRAVSWKQKCEEYFAQFGE